MKMFNAFSLQMINTPMVVKFEEIDANEIPTDNIESFIGHQDLANILSNMLNTHISYNRSFGSITSDDDYVVVAQLTGGRLPEGCTLIPEGMSLKFIKVTLLP